jgi:hypothetical protein
MKIQPLDFNINIMKALLWRHNEAENLQALMQYKQDAVDALNEEFWDDWIVNVFDLQTANAFGLSVWALILNIPLTVSSSDDPIPDNINFGFGSFRKNFDHGNFTPINEETTLSLEDARTLLKLRYYQLITRATVPECNKIVTDVFSDNTVFVVDGLDMTMTYVFANILSSSLRAALAKFDVLPRPSGVKLNVYYIPENPNRKFGFGSLRGNFDNSNFR